MGNLRRRLGGTFSGYVSVRVCVCMCICVCVCVRVRAWLLFTGCHTAWPGWLGGRLLGRPCPARSPSPSLQRWRARACAAPLPSGWCRPPGGPGPGGSPPPWRGARGPGRPPVGRAEEAAGCAGCWTLLRPGPAYLRAPCSTASAGVVEEGPAQALPQQPPVVPQLLRTQPRPPATPLQQELQLALPAGGDGEGDGGFLGGGNSQGGGGWQAGQSSHSEPEGLG